MEDDDNFYDAEDGFTKAIAIVGHAAGAVGVPVPVQPLPTRGKASSATVSMKLTLF